MARLNITVSVHTVPDEDLVKMLESIRRYQRETNTLIKRIGAHIMATVEDFSAEVTELAGLVETQSTDIDTLAQFITDHAAELPDSLLTNLRSAVDKVSGNSTRLVELAQAAPEVPTDPGTSQV